MELLVKQPQVKQRQAKQQKAEKAKKAKRNILNELSVFDVICCVLVVFIHISSEPVTMYSNDSLQFKLFFIFPKASSFVVPAFMFLSAVKFSKAEKQLDYLKFIKQRFIKIYLPYVLWTVIYYLYEIWRSRTEFNTGQLVGHIIKGDVSAQFYFIIAIMQFYILMPLWLFICKKIRGRYAIIISLILTLFFRIYFESVLNTFVNNEKIIIAYTTYSDRIFTSYLVYWVLGCFAGKNYESFKRIISKHKYEIHFTYIIWTAVHIYWCYISALGVKPYLYAEYGHMLFCLLSILNVYTVSVEITDNQKSKLPVKLSSVSFYVFLSHCLLIFVINRFMTLQMLNEVGTRFFVRAGFVYILSFLAGFLYLSIKKQFNCFILKKFQKSI